MQETDYHINKLKECLEKKKKINPLYSLRAFSKDLGINGGSMSHILNGSRKLPLAKAHSIAESLSLSPQERFLFLESVLGDKYIVSEESKEQYLLDESYYKVIAEWEHYAVLELLNLDNFQFNLENIANKLKLTIERVEIVLKNLLQSELLILNENNRYSQVHSSLKTTEDIKSSALKESHIETLNMGIGKLKEVDILDRDFSSSTLAMSLKKLPEAKQLIRKFRKDMALLFESSTDKDEVFQLAIQFYPLTNINKHKKTEVNKGLLQ